LNRVELKTDGIDASYHPDRERIVATASLKRFTSLVVGVVVLVRNRAHNGFVDEMTHPVDAVRFAAAVVVHERVVKSSACEKRNA